MDYLGVTIKYLEQENKDLKEKLKRMSDLNQSIIRQRQTQDRDYLQLFHQQQIAVIRQMADKNDKDLRSEIKKQNSEILQLNATLEKDLDTILQLKRQIQKLKQENNQLSWEKANVHSQLQSLEAKQKLQGQQFQQKYKCLQQEFKGRQQEVISNYMMKLEEAKQNFEEDLRRQTKFVDFLQNKLNNTYKQHQVFEQQTNKIIKIFKQQEQRLSNKNKLLSQQLSELRRQNNSIRLHNKNVELEMVGLQSQVANLQQKILKLEKQNSQLQYYSKQLERVKNKQIQRERSKIKSLSKDLSQNKKNLKEKIQTEKTKQRIYNDSKKLLINKIKQIETKFENEKSSRSLFDKTSMKTIKKSADSFQSISLDNSFSKDSPSVSCFLKDDKHELSKQSKKLLTINTKLCNSSALKIKDLDTPCFQNSRQKGIKRTIKIKK